MGQREEDDVRPAQRVGVRGDQGPVGEGWQLRMHLTQAPPSLGSRSNRTHLEVGVPEEKSEQLTPGVAGGAGNRRGEGHGRTIRIHA